MNAIVIAKDRQSAILKALLCSRKGQEEKIQPYIIKLSLPGHKYLNVMNEVKAAQVREDSQ